MAAAKSTETKSALDNPGQPDIGKAAEVRMLSISGPCCPSIMCPYQVRRDAAAPEAAKAQTVIARRKPTPAYRGAPGLVSSTGSVDREQIISHGRVLLTAISTAPTSGKAAKSATGVRACLSSSPSCQLLKSSLVRGGAKTIGQDEDSSAKARGAPLNCKVKYSKGKRQRCSVLCYDRLDVSLGKAWHRQCVYRRRRRRKRGHRKSRLN